MNQKMENAMSDIVAHDVTRKTLPDWVATVLRFAPWIGPLAELVPHQRLDRIARYVEALDCRLREIDEEHPRRINDALQDGQFAGLLEESLRQAARSLSDDRRQYLSNLVVNGMTEREVEYHESQHILRILNELGDIEIVWLRYYLVRTNEYYKRHSDILSPFDVSLASPQAEIDHYYRKRALRNSYIEHLCRLGLLTTSYRMEARTPLPHKIELPVYDTFTGRREKKDHDITRLGRLLLEQIGAGHIQSPDGND